MTVKAKAEIQQLTAQINEHNHHYFNLDKPKISDSEYDKLVQELINLEKKYPNYKRADSPTSKINGTPSDDFNQIQHKIPMLSLSNIFNAEASFVEFQKKIKKQG